MKYKLITKVFTGEYWYGGYVDQGSAMPFSRFGIKRIDLTKSYSNSHSNTLLVSSFGRYIYSKDGFKISKIGPILTIRANSEIRLESGYNDLKGAYLDYISRFATKSPVHPEFFQLEKPQYSTWMALGKSVDSKSLLSYAENILKSGFGAGELIIDDGWQQEYGDWTFDKEKFPSPKDTISDLKKLGFKVLLWVVPFVSKDAKSFSYLADHNALIKNRRREIAYRSWWNGSSALLDMSSADATDWLKTQLDLLKNEYGIDGFKFDGGDSSYYKDSDITAIPYATCDRQTQLYVDFSKNYNINEYRVSTRNGGAGIIARLSDKSHIWGTRFGLHSLVPEALALGIIGLPYVCPDMVGGGQILNKKDLEFLDKQLLLRWLETSILMPVCQFSVPIWDDADKEFVEQLKTIFSIRREYIDIIKDLYEDSLSSCQPIIRYMEYEYPHQGLGKVNDQFLLGSDLIIAPVLQKNRGYRVVYLPKDSVWKSLISGIEYAGGKPVEILCKPEELIIMKKVR